MEYPDNTFSVAQASAGMARHGPLMRAEVGDTLMAEFLNRSRRVHAIHPHGLRYEKSGEGAHYVPMFSGYWRDEEHPALLMLPPFQMDANQDEVEKRGF